MNQVLTA